MIEPPRIVETEEEIAAVVHLNVPRSDLPKVVPAAIGELMKAIAAQGVAPRGPLFMHHLTMSTETFDVEVGFPVTSTITPTGRVKPGKLPAAKVARTIYQGPYEGLYGAWDAFGKRLETEGIIDGLCVERAETLWESYLVGPETTSDQSRWRTELNLPLNPAATRSDTRCQPQEHAMNTYTDFYVMPVKTARIEDYCRFAAESRKAWLAHGALSVTEYIADDVTPGVHTSFPQSVKLEPDESVAVAVLTFASREDGTRIKAAVMKDPVFASMGDVPVDGKRMFWGGSKPLVGSAQVTAPAVQPYLFFRGRCDEAMNYYKATLGARIVLAMRFKDNPDKPPRDKVPAELDERIMHAQINIAGTDLMMSDGMKSGPLDFQCMSLSLSVATEAEADSLYNALSKDGVVQMPMGPTFFAKRFGAVADKFGVSWMIMVPPHA